MTNEQKQVKDWMLAFGQETPEKPTIPSLEVRKLRAKLIYEECLETIHALGLFIHYSGAHSKNWIENYSFSSSEEIKNSAEYQLPDVPQIEPNLELIADGCEDLKVVTEGTLVACGLCQVKKVPMGIVSGLIELYSDPLFDEVMRSNWTKLWTQKEIDKEFPDENGYEKSGKEGWTVIKLKMNPEVSNRIYLVKDKDGKVIKSPSYKPANLQPIINELSK